MSAPQEARTTRGIVARQAAARTDAGGDARDGAALKQAAAHAVAPRG
ncbi:MAG TPA: hypothetical protein VGM56_04990 [Byssovorax sp.]|jgi:hypothetical protein